jgi:PadR family transcriptional regulator
VQPDECIIITLSLANVVSAEMAKSNSAQNALDLLVLTIVERRGPLHGYGIATAIEELSQEALRVEEGSLYPALHRMEELGWIAAEWKVSETNRRARFYRVTNAGKKQLESESERWTSFSAGVSRVLRHA